MAQNVKRTQKRSPSRNQGPTYEQMLPTFKTNLDTFESFFYAQLMKSGEHGKEGMKNGLHASIWGLRNKIGLEGILDGLEVQGMQSIESGNGLNAKYNLAAVIENNAKTYSETVSELKVQDLIPYLQERLGDVEIVEKSDYKDRKLKDLMGEKASKESRLYGAYLMAQLGSAVMAKMGAAVYQEQAQKMTENYKSGNLTIKEK